jgi:hypothetical protein
MDQFQFCQYLLILEILIYKRVVTFLNKHNVISEAKNCFREKICTNTAIQTFIEDIQKAVDNTLLLMGIILDLTKAFDVLNHELLFAKLELYGLRGKINSLTSSYLTDRTQFVEIQQLDAKTLNIKMCNLSCKEIKYGVTEGSVLRLLFVLLFIRDLSQGVQEVDDSLRKISCL